MPAARASGTPRKRRARWSVSPARMPFSCVFVFRKRFPENALAQGRRRPRDGGARAEVSATRPRRRPRLGVAPRVCAATRPRAGRARRPSRRRGGWRAGASSRRSTMNGLGTKTPAASGAARRATSGRRGRRSGVRPRHRTCRRRVGAWGRYRQGNSPGASSSPGMPNRPRGTRQIRHRNAHPPSPGRTGPRPRGRTREVTRRPPPQTPRLRLKPRRGAGGTCAPTPTSCPRPMENSTTRTAFLRAFGAVGTPQIRDLRAASFRGQSVEILDVVLTRLSFIPRGGRHRRHTDRAHHEPAAGHLSGIHTSPVRRRRAFAGRTSRDLPRTHVPPRARRLRPPSIRGLSRRERRQSRDTPSRDVPSPALFRTRHRARRHVLSPTFSSCPKSAST